MDLSLSTFEPVLKALAVAGLPTLEGTLTSILSEAVLGPAGALISPEFNRVWPAINRAMGLAPDAIPDTTAAAITADPSGAAQKLAAVQEQHAYLLDSFKAQAAADLSTLQERDKTDLSGDAGQNVLNQDAARSTSFFVYGPRPAVMWGFGALAVSYGFAPLFGWMVDGFFGLKMGTAPQLAWEVWLGLFALLGIVAALRSYDKANGTAGLPPAAPASNRRFT